MARRSWLPEPSDVVSGRVRVTIEQLFALIHQVNPTDQGLGARQQAEGYALKSRLQSLLVRQYPDLLAVERHPTDERVVSIQHRVAGRDACHAMVPSLDDDARRWVETELALAARNGQPAGVRDAPAPANRPSATEPGDPMAVGRAAMEAYDYDEARRVFSAAIDRSPGDLAAAEALLELLVNHLADDEAAVAVGERLLPPASANRAVLGCLALAAARHGDVSLARKWLKGADNSGAVEVWVLLGDRAARAGELTDTRACITAAQDLDPGHPALPRLREAAARLQADERAPAEAALAAAVVEGEMPHVERLARDLLTRWPGSDVARAALRDVARWRKEQECRELVGRAWQAWHRGDAASLLAAIAQVRALDVADAATVAWMAEAEAAGKEQVEAARFTLARDALARGALLAGLTEWLALPTGTQDELRSAFDLPEFAWLDVAPAGEGRVAAVVSLGEARRLFHAGDLEGAERAMEPHLRVLRALPDARSLVNDIATRRADLAARELHAAERGVAEARAAGEFDRAAALAAALPPDARRRARAEIDAERAAATALRLEEDARAGGDLLRARELARKRGALDLVAELTARLRDEWRITVSVGVDPGVVDVTLPLDPVCPLPWLVDDGAAFVHVQVSAGWVFARVIELETTAVRRVVSFRAPHALRVHYVHVDDDVVTVVDLWGALLAFRLSDGDIVRWLPRPPGTRDEDTSSEGAVLAPGGRYLWLAFQAAGSVALRVYDTEHWPSFRTAEFAYPVPLLGNEEPRVARVAVGKGITIHAANGNRVGKQVLFGDTLATRVCAHPDGFPVCALVAGSTTGNARVAALSQAARIALPPDPIAFSAVNSDRVNATRATYPTSRLGQPHQLAVATGEGAVYVKVGPGGGSEISVYRPQPNGQLATTGTPSWAPQSVLLLTDARGFRVRAVALGEHALREVRLHDPQPETERVAAHREHYTSSWPGGGVDFDLGCGFGATLTETAKSLLRTLKEMPIAERDGWIVNFKLAEDNAPSLFELASALRELDRRGEAHDLFEATGERFPDHPRTRLLRAEVSAHRGGWADVQKALEGVDVASLDGASAQHLLHLRGIAHLRVGDVAAGKADIRKAALLLGPCAIRVPACLVDLLDGLPAPSEPDATEAYVRGRLTAVLDGIVAADRLLGEGDALGAIAALDTVLVWRSRDRQPLARLAQAWLDVHPREPVQELRRRLALATFLGVHDDYEDGYGRDLPIRPLAWGKDRLAGLAERVRAELAESA